MSTDSQIQDSRGSVWHRWDPHLHAPGTILNDQFEGADPWERFLARIEAATPQIRVLGITDYLNIDCYRKAVAYRKSGRIPSVGMVFPNVEVRLDIQTEKKAGINLHMLFAPDDPDHMAQIERFLARLEFSFKDQPYRCQKSDLISLGKAFQSSIINEKEALEVGTKQFKVNFGEFQKRWKEDAWALANGLIAVAVGSGDGTSGLAPDSSFKAQREEIERFAHIIFSGNPAQREFWLGRGADTVEVLEKKWNGRKPCLHGSDAHSHDKVGTPDKERFCWIKGDLTFESLRQACIEPDGRTYIDSAPPRGALPGNVVSQLTVTNAPWLQNESLKLNSGLVTVIGARGSGKTALADLIAAGGYALSPHLNTKSFILRAADHLADAASELQWESGEKTSNALNQVENEDLLDAPRVQYLSQHFVDQLCSSDSLGGSLIDEIERVVFQAHPISERMGATSFSELLEIRAENARANRTRNQQGLEDASDEMILERARKASLPTLMKQKNEKAAAIEKDKKDRQALMGKAQPQLAKQLEEVSNAIDKKRNDVDSAKRTLRALVALKDDVSDCRERRFPAIVSNLIEKYAESHLSGSDWNSFQVQFTGDIDTLLVGRTKNAQEVVHKLEGQAPPVTNDTAPTVGTSYLAPNSILVDQPLKILEAELSRLQKLVGIDSQNAKRLSLLSEKISKEETALGKLLKDIERVGEADERIKALHELRRKTYEVIFSTIVEEEQELRKLYEPLSQALSQQSGSLAKLTFSVRRVVDSRSWAAMGESLLDLRVNGPFRGKGALLTTAQEVLIPAWAHGDALSVSKALATFREQHEASLLAHAPVDVSDKDATREWGRRVGMWLYSTNHISISYRLQYDGVDIDQLSPGTRGIVLLLLYLAIDAEDDRPLIIDQPEENLDPQSIFNELVGRFKEAKLRRQIIIVTHNANLVVNTDADQVIIAECGPHREGQLPEITYVCGGLENPKIRNYVCQILEGGEQAFKERAKRLRVVI